LTPQHTEHKEINEQAHINNQSITQSINQLVYLYGSSKAGLKAQKLD